MHRIIIFALLACCLPLSAADTPIVLNVSATGPEDLRVAGPTEGDVGEKIELVVRGLPEVDESQTIGELLDFFRHVRIAISQPGEPITLDSEVGFSIAPVAYRMKLIFTPDEPGVYVVAVDWNQPPYGLALHRVTIRGPPVPPEPPDPPQPPTPVQSVMILRESGDQDATLASTINQLRNNLELSKRIHLVADPDMKNPLDNEPIPLIEAAKQLVGNEPLPRLIGLNSSLDPVAHAPMPVDYSGAVDALKIWGIE